MKTLKEILNEYGTIPGYSDGGADGEAVDNQSEISIYDLEKPESIDLINAFLSQASQHSYVNPTTPYNRIKQKLAIAGLDIPRYDFRGQGYVEDSTTIRVPVKLFGGRSGDDLYTGEVGMDDGVEDKIPGGLFLVLNVTKYNGRYFIHAKVEPGLQPEDVED